MFTSLFETLRDRAAKRRQYRKLISEIAMLTQDDLIDIGAFQIDLYQQAHRQVYG